MFNRFPVSYVEPVFRPPSEANSLIFQVTNGCSWNRCTYCDRYTDAQKKFRPRDEIELLEITIFRSDHISIHLILKGLLGRDKNTLLAQIRQASEYFEQYPGYQRSNHVY